MKGRRVGAVAQNIIANGYEPRCLGFTLSNITLTFWKEADQTI